MQIETGFRDTKNPYDGLGLTDLSRIKPERYKNLLIIVALAMLGLWIVAKKRLRKTPIYSLFFIAKILFLYKWQ